MAVKDIQLRHVPYGHFVLPLLRYAILDHGNRIDSLTSETTGQDTTEAEGGIKSLTTMKWRRMKQDRNEEEVLPTIDILHHDSVRFSAPLRNQQRFSTLWLRDSETFTIPDDTKLGQEQEAAIVDLVIFLAPKLHERGLWPDFEGIKVTQRMLEAVKLDLFAQPE